jgi:hypothetical protein
VLLTCPNCQSGLQVPDGTTAHVRCPGCGTVFPAETGAAAAVPVELPPPPPPPPPPPARPAPPRRRDEEDDRPRRPARPRDEDNRPRRRPRDDEDEDDEEEDRPRPRRTDRDREVSPEQKRAERAAFLRAMWGCRLVQHSFTFYILAMIVIVFFFVRLSLGVAMPGLIVAAGVLGLCNWVLGAVGVGLCLSGPKSPGHYRFGIAAAFAVGVHLIFLLALVSKAELPPAYRADPESGVDKWGQVPTRLDGLTFYLTLAAYADRLSLPAADVALPILAGLAEMVRAVLLMMVVACLARAAGDEEVSQKCTRAAGAVSFGPGAMAVVVLIVAGIIVESNADTTTFGKILFTVLLMGVYVVLAGVMVPAAVAARDAAEACESPYQSREDRLAG